MDWKISVGAILVALLGALIGHRLTTARDDRNTYQEKANTLKELLVPFLRELEDANAHVATLITQSFQQHDEAARKVRLYMSRCKRRRFDAKWSAYEALYKEKKGQGLLGLIATEVDDLAKASVNTIEGQRYLFEQSEKRRKQAILVIDSALAVL